MILRSDIDKQYGEDELILGLMRGEIQPEDLLEDSYDIEELEAALCTVSELIWEMQGSGHTKED